jgi:enamine deaminase RidA (YjgF/YER057c/UK114 family)
MQLYIQSIQSPSEGDFSTQLHSCIGQIGISSDNSNISQKILKITLFTSCSDNDDYLLKMSLLGGIQDWCQAPVSLVSQPPMEGRTIMEVWMMDSGPDHSFAFNRGEQASALFIDCPDFSCLVSAQYSAKHQIFGDNAREAYSMLDAALFDAGFDYSHIVRQWNYIEGITQTETVQDRRLQNYQEFNDLRSLCYKKSNFINGYPSATGIGVANGGCLIEALALKEKKSKNVKPVTNSLQVDAHSYSSEVLDGVAVDAMKELSTPKFERGKYIQMNGAGFFFVSGTASILGEQTVFPEDAGRQTATTIQIIDSLMSFNNLKNNKINLISQPAPVNYRVYLKNESDYSVVKSLCDAYFGVKNGIFVKADICRSNLLVEIEANYRI